ncbi:MAG TPA: hypothetical protein VMP89_02270, partial [Solirubrobacteraceae bacterium]|nr:hypothetical protein [Solirubrobacteraceae bacterium]
MRALERAAVVVAALALSFLLIALLSGFFTSRDQGALAGTAAVAGHRFRDLGDALLRPGQPAPRYDSSPPTSGAHLPEQVTRDGAELDDNQLLGALASGDVVILFGTPAPYPALTALAAALAPSFTPALASTGGAVILARRPGTTGLIGL